MSEVSKVFAVQAPTEQVIEVDSILSIKATVSRLVNALEEAKHEQKLINEKLKSVLENDQNYCEALEAVEEVSKKVKLIKQAINIQPEYTSIKVAKKEKAEEIKEIKATLSDHLANYIRIAQVNSMETPSGDEVDLVQVVSIKPKQLKLFLE